MNFNFHREGNAVHTVHLWQPSGNRPNKPKMPGERKKKSCSDRKYKSTGETTKRAPRKKKVESAQLKMVPPPANMIIEHNPMQFHNPACEYTTRCFYFSRCFHLFTSLNNDVITANCCSVASYVPGPSIMQPVHNISAPTLPHTQPPPLTGPQVSPPGPQPMQPMGPIMQQRPDCRLAQPVGPPVSSQGSSVVYPPCMVGSNSHTTHMEQPDPLNYEPYMWNF